MPDHIVGRRIRVEADGRSLYYDIDADGLVYWLRIRHDNHIQRYRVTDEDLILKIKEIADGAG